MAMVVTMHFLWVFLLVAVCFVCFLVLFVFVFETGSCYVAQASLELSVSLAQPPKCWDYMCTSPHPAIFLFFIEFVNYTCKFLPYW
jgi:hypothetical protein